MCIKGREEELFSKPSHQLQISAKMYGKITTQAVQKTMTDRMGNMSNCVREASVSMTQIETNATEKKWLKRTRGCWIRPARSPTGPLM